MFHSKVPQCSRMMSATGCGRCTELGLLEGTLVRTRLGYRPIETLTMQDELAVFPHSFKRLDSMRHHLAYVESAACPHTALPVLIPAGALGIHGELVLQHDMRVLLTDPDLRPILGTSNITIRAADLVGFRGISLIRPQTMRLVVLAFESEEVITIDDAFRVVVPPEKTRIGQKPGTGWGGVAVYPLNANQAEDYLANLDTEMAKLRL